MATYHFNKGMLYFLLICNLLGTVYGYIWYGSQMSATPWQFIPFVPDSPTASLFLCIAILGLIVNKNLPIIRSTRFCHINQVWSMGCNYEYHSFYSIRYDYNYRLYVDTFSRHYGN